jgi:uncharacterized protein YggE
VAKKTELLYERPAAFARRRTTTMMLSRASVGFLLALSSTGCHHPDGPHKFRMSGVSVTGTGDFEAKPDIARITVGCESQAPSAAEATQATTTKIAAIIAAIKQAGVQDKDVQTAQLSVYSEQVAPPPYPPSPMPAAAPGKGAASSSLPVPPPLPQFFYRATNTVSVTIRQLDRAGAIVGAAFAAGANQAGGIQFDVENHQPLEDQARAKAVLDATHRAQELARLTNVKLGRILSVTEGSGPDLGPQPMYAAKAASFRSEGSVTPVEGGQIKVTYVVQVVYALGD